MVESLAEQQVCFAAHLRNPALHPAPAGVEERRLEIYRGLFFRNISSLLAKNFPVLRKLHDNAAWESLVRDFYDEHRAHTPLFPEIPREFLLYLEHRGTQPGDRPFALELAHYEWVELALDVDVRVLEPFTPTPSAELLAGCPVVSPLAWLLSYRYPVHRISPEYQPQQAPEEPTHLLVYRDRADKVHFMQLNDVSLRLLSLLKEDTGLTGEMALTKIAAELQHPEPARILEAGTHLLKDFARREVILGAQLL